MTAPGLNEATDALVEFGRSSPLIGHDLTQRRTSRNVAARALKAARPVWYAIIREIHVKIDRGGGIMPICSECLRDWPCPTVKAFREEKPKPQHPQTSGYAAWMAALAGQGPS